jgi:hypothetical protein
MNPDAKTARYLGAAFLFVFVASLVTQLPGASRAELGISDLLADIAANVPLLRLSILVELANSLGIVVLAALLYVVLRSQSKTIALVALGWWWAEALMLAISKIGTYALIPLSQEFVAAGAPKSSYYQTLADFLYHGIDRQGYLIHVLFFGVGAILWYSLFYRSRFVPRALSIWGLASVSLVVMNSVLVLYDPGIGNQLYLLVPYLLFEPAIGLWLVVKGLRVEMAGG